MVEVEAAYNASWEQAAEKLPALIDRLMCIVALGLMWRLSHPMIRV